MITARNLCLSLTLMAALGGCATDTSDAPTAQSSAALSANEPAKVDPSMKPRGPDALLARWDQDGDGKVSIADLPERLRSRLARADANGDGILTRDELAQAHEAMRAEREKRDGIGSNEERTARRAERFARADQNHDGALSADEVPGPVWEHIRVADANGDGKVTSSELDVARASGQLKPPRHHPGHGAFGAQ